MTGYIFRTEPLTTDQRVGYVFETGAAPVVHSLVPTTAALGAPNFTLRVLGEGFTPHAVIEWNGGAEPTTFVSPEELTTVVNMATASVAGAVPVAVRVGNYVRSNAQTFLLTGA